MMTILEKINGWHPTILSIAAVGISFTDINEILRTGILAVTFIYLIWKGWHEYQKSKKSK